MNTCPLAGGACSEERFPAGCGGRARQLSAFARDRSGSLERASGAETGARGGATRGGFPSEWRNRRAPGLKACDLSGRNFSSPGYVIYFWFNIRLKWVLLPQVAKRGFQVAEKRL